MSSTWIGGKGMGDSIGVRTFGGRLLLGGRGYECLVVWENLRKEAGRGWAGRAGLDGSVGEGEDGEKG